MRSPIALVTATSLIALPAPARAAEAAPDPLAATAAAVAAESAEGEQIVVEGQRDRYRVRAVSSATRTDTPLKDLPQAVSIITAEQIDDQAMRSVADVLRYVPGASLSGGEGHRDQIALRGQATTADFFVDGFRDDVQYYRGLYNLERVEVLKGPNAMIFGRGGGGGIVNRVTKRPVEQGFSSFVLSPDSRGAWFAQGDVNLPIAGNLLGRLNAVYEEFDSFRDFYEGHRIGVNPTLALTPGPDTRIDVGFEYARDRRVVDRGVPSAGNGSLGHPAKPLDGFDRTFFGDPDLNRSRFDGYVGNVRVEHRFNDRLRLVSKALYGDYDKFYRNVMAQTPVTNVGGVDRVGIEAYESGTERQNLLFQTDLIAEFETGGLGHTFLVGADYAGQDTLSTRQQGFFAPGPFTSSSNRRFSTPLAEEIFVPDITFSCVASLGCTDAKSDGSAIGLYVQDQVKIGELVEVVAGLRHDRFTLEVDDRIAPASFERTDSLWSPRLGLVIKPTERLSLYGSFSRSFLPQSGDQFSSLTPSTAALEPERFTNYEVGAKWQPLPNLDLTLAAYQLDRTNTRETDPVSSLVLLTGEQRSKGIEFTANGEVTKRLSISGGIALQEAEVRKSSTASLVGRKTPLVPKFQASLWGRYDFTSRVGAGLGVYHQSKSFASISNAVVLPAFTRVDAAAFLGLGRGIEAAINVENVLDSDYTALAFNDNNLTPGNPRTVRATLRFGL